MTLANAMAILLYLSCSVFFIRLFVQRDQGATPPSFPISILILLALTCHAADIFFSMKQAGGWDLGLFSSLSMASWLMALLAFVFSGKYPNSHPGIIIFPLAVISLVLKFNLPSAYPTALSQPALEWHILLSLAAYSLLTMAALQAFVLSIQERQLHQQHLNGFMQKLPPLQTMESMLFQLLHVGFILLTVSLITGFIFIDNLLAQHLVHKTILSAIAWLIFAVLLWGRWHFGWRGKVAAKGTLIGFIFLVLAYFGTKLVLEFILRAQ